MSEETRRWQVGSARVTSIVEAQTEGIPPAFFFPEADERLITGQPWLGPDYADVEGRIGLRVQAFVIEAAGRTVVVDPCVGNGKTREQPFWNEQSWPFLERLEGAGFDRHHVDLVVHTHLHVDHVGWDTHRVDGRWVATFPEARYLYVEPEFTWSRAETDADSVHIHDDSVGPVFAAGLADVVAPDADLGGGLRCEPTVGHTPGHVSLWLESEGGTALLTGDVLHHPVQCAVPSLAFVSDDDAELARDTRRRLLAVAAGTDALVFGTHFATCPAGHVVRHGDAWRFEPAPDTP